MNHTNLMRQAWHFVRYYRAMWIFGVILALTTVSWSGISLLSDEDKEGLQLNLNIQPGDSLSDIYSRAVSQIKELDYFAFEETNQEIDKLLLEEFHVEANTNIGRFLFILVCVLAVTHLLAKVAGYVSETAMIRMVNAHQKTGQKYRVREGFQMGWSREAWRLFLLDLAIIFLVGVIITLLLVLGLAPWVTWSTGIVAAGVIGMITSVVIFILGILLIIAMIGVISLLRPVIQRACVLEGLGVIASVRRGMFLVRQHLQGAGLTWLIFVSIRSVWPLLLAPVVLVLTIVGGALGGLAALLTYGIAQLVTISIGVPVLMAVTVGISVFILGMAVPLTFLGGLREVFLSSLWTLTYRELRELSSTKTGVEIPGKVDHSGSEVMAST